MAISTKNIVDMLERHDADELDLLRKSFPNEKELLSKHRLMGVGDQPRQDTMALKFDLARVALKTVRTRCDVLLEWSSRRIRRASKVRTFGSAVAAAASAGLIASIVKVFYLNSTAANLSLATIAFLSSIITIFADRLGGSGSVKATDLFDETLRVAGYALKLEGRSRTAKINNAVADIDQILVELDEHSIQLYQIEMKSKLL